MKASALSAFVTLVLVASQLGTIVWGNGISPQLIWGD